MYKTASVEILDDEHDHDCESYPCESLAQYNVFDGHQPMYACGRHLTTVIRLVATRK